MSNQQEFDFGEPWAAAGDGLIDRDDGTICEFTAEWGETPLTDANQARIVACVNACRDLPTSFLEGSRLADWLGYSDGDG